MVGRAVRTDELTRRESESYDKRDQRAGHPMAAVDAYARSSQNGVADSN